MGGGCGKARGGVIPHPFGVSYFIQIQKAPGSKLGLSLLWRIKTPSRVPTAAVFFMPWHSDNPN